MWHGKLRIITQTQTQYAEGRSYDIHGHFGDYLVPKMVIKFKLLGERTLMHQPLNAISYNAGCNL